MITWLKNLFKIQIEGRYKGKIDLKVSYEIYVEVKRLIEDYIISLERARINIEILEKFKYMCFMQLEHEYDMWSKHKILKYKFEDTDEVFNRVIREVNSYFQNTLRLY